ncbi:uroporphyrinogen-III C-methyltransferase [Sulfitobacter albidus]|uniref:Uroporphyrinogen-III C-methyltransferase n=1 Tax=Sulfitobacter albidus TaxID=2829501 RepID=A0A975JFM2_9RHOB|nr:siroheme synthase CysG [Sulfitobacter albidus]QUJ77321.1 uroporphyrinogen-III C-methyltransferase [Sulfitobacter albidus]
MKSFPMFIKTTNRRVVIAGGGEQAAQKARLMLKTDAQIVLLADRLEDELQGLVEAHRATQMKGPISASSFEGAAMVFIGTGCPGIDASLHAIAKAASVPVNVVDQPDLCDITTPSLVDREPVVVAIGTEGTAPVLARGIKTQIEQLLDPSLGSFAALAGRMRSAVAQKVPRAQRRAFWGWAFREAPWQAHKRGAEREAATLLKEAISNGGAVEAEATGSISLVGAGPGARDLLTLRAVERLQEADIIFYDRLVDPEVLELARRDAERVFVGKVVGASAWPQERICAVIVAAVKQGKRVVRLKSGDPMLFGRATEELDAARAAGIPIEVVPGITAASAAAAALQRPLTSRGETDTVVFSTGQTQPGADTPDWHSRAVPGTTLAFYMAIGKSAEIAAQLIARGLPASTKVTVAANVSKPSQSFVETCLGALDRDLKKHQINGCSILLVTCPRSAPMQSADKREGAFRSTDFAAQARRADAEQRSFRLSEHFRRVL